MKKAYALAFVLFLSATSVAHASVIGQQLTAAATSTNFYGGGSIYNLPDLNGTLKAFDMYVSLTGCGLSNNHCNVADSALYVEIDSNTASEHFSTDTYTSVPHGTGSYPDPVLVRFVWDQAASTPTGYPTFTSGTLHTIQLGTSNGSSITSGVVATMTDGSNNIYFVGYDALGTKPTLSSVSIASNNGSTTMAKAGDTVTLTFTATTPDGPMQTPSVTIGAHSGVSVATSSTSGNDATYTASTTLDLTDTEGGLTFSVVVANKYGDNSAAGTATTDGTSVTFDNAAPTLAITTGPAEGGVSTSSPTVFTFTNSDSQATTSCSFDGVATSTCSGTASAALGDGAHTLYLGSSDAAGNATSTTRAFSVDLTPPTLDITDGPAANATIATSSVSFTFATNATSTECSYDGAATSTCSSPFATTSADGAHTFALSAVDENGNTAYLSRSFTVDTAPAPTPAPAATGGGGGNGPIVGSGPLSLGYQAPGSVAQATEPAPTLAPAPAPTQVVSNQTTPAPDVGLAPTPTPTLTNQTQTNVQAPSPAPIEGEVSAPEPQVSGSQGAAVATAGSSLPWILALAGLGAAAALAFLVSFFI